MSKVTAQQIKDWKEKHGNVHLITYNDGREAYLKDPDRNIIALSQSKMAEAPILGAEAIMVNCWLAGDESLKEDNAALMGLQGVLNELVVVKEATIKKL